MKKPDEQTQRDELFYDNKDIFKQKITAPVNRWIQRTSSWCSSVIMVLPKLLCEVSCNMLMPTCCSRSCVCVRVCFSLSGSGVFYNKICQPQPDTIDKDISDIKKALYAACVFNNDTWGCFISSHRQRKVFLRVMKACKLLLTYNIFSNVIDGFITVYNTFLQIVHIVTQVYNWYWTFGDDADPSIREFLKFWKWYISQYSYLHRINT